MRRKLIIGAILFIAGVLLDVVSDITEIWLIGCVAGILWPVGMVMGINALISLKHKKQDSDQSIPVNEKDDRR